MPNTKKKKINLNNLNNSSNLKSLNQSLLGLDFGNKCFLKARKSNKLELFSSKKFLIS